ncbi:hypothetical protein Peur_003009 [Populus x canadensis]
MFEVLKISGPQLVNLTDLEYVCGNKLEISAPKLTFFKFIPYYSHLSVTHLPSLEHANVDIYRPYAYPRKIEVCYPNFFKLMQGFHNAQFITLNSEIIEILFNDPDVFEHQPSPFSRLKSLKLKVGHEDELLMMPAKVMAYFFSGSPAAQLCGRCS